MRKRKIGSVEVTVVGIGCNNFGRELDVDLTQRVIHVALDQGINLSGAPPVEGSRIAAKDEQKRAAIFSGRNMKIVTDLTRYAQSRGHSLLDLAFAWLLAHPAIPSDIAGVSSPEQVAANARAAAWELSAEEVAEVERLAPLA